MEDYFDANFEEYKELLLMDKIIQCADNVCKICRWYDKCSDALKTNFSDRACKEMIMLALIHQEAEDLYLNLMEDE